MNVPLSRCRVVLVRPEVAANIGATARAMRNFGLNDLVLVAPVADPLDRESRRLATQGESILQTARVVPDLDTALSDCVCTVATSALTAGLYRAGAAGPPSEIMPILAARLVDGPVALVFGPEPHGLTNVEVARCQWLIHIPADPSYPVLNLAQSVAVSLYALRVAWLAQTQPEPRSDPATDAELQRMFTQLQRALEAVHFLYGPKADPLMNAVRRIVTRSAPSRQDVRILFGLARQLLWFADHHRPNPSGSLESPRPPKSLSE